MKKVRKAVIAAAGMGTRFLPQTKAMPKEMLPVVDKPVIQLVVEGLVEAGVEDIIIVTGPTKRSIEDHFDRSLELEDALRSKRKPEVADQIQSIAELANFIYVRQKGEPVGNARPILNASHIVGDEPFFFFFADDFFTNEVSTASQLLEAYNEKQGPVVALREVPESELSMYGVARIADEPDKSGIARVTGIHEKPAIKEAPSNYAVASGYLLTPDIFPILEKENVGTGGELQIADGFEELSKNRDTYGLLIKGHYHDTGNPLAYLKTVVTVALQDEEYGSELLGFLQDIVAE